MSTQVESGMGKAPFQHSRKSSNYAGLVLSRRRLLQLSGLGAASALLTACIGQPISDRDQPTLDPKQPIPVPAPRPEPAAVEQPFADSELQLIGKELDDWEITTQNSRLRMAEAFDDIKLAADILRGRKNPKIYLSHLRLPITLGKASGTAVSKLTLLNIEDHQDPRKIEIPFPQGNFTYPWIKEAVGRIGLSDDLRKTTTAKLPFVVKELLQLRDINTYYRFYFESNPDARAYFQNPARIPTPSDQILFARGMHISEAEYSNFKYSPLDLYIDTGEAITIFALLYATWQLNEQRQGRIIPDTDWGRLGNRYADYLKDKSLLVEKDGLMTWPSGKTPKIDSAEFVILADEYIKKFYPGYHIIEGYRLRQ